MNTISSGRLIRNCCLVLSMLAALTFCGAAPVTVISLQEGVNGYHGTEDVSLFAGRGGFPDKNYGGEELLQIWEREEGMQNLRRVLMRFDLSSIKPDTVISGATLTLFTLPDTWDRHGVTNSLYLVDPRNKDWHQGIGVRGNSTNGATWDFLDQSAVKRWAGGAGLISGADYHPTPVATADTPDTTEAEQKEGNVPMKFVLNAAGVAAIQKWINKPAFNAGFFIRQPDNSLSVDTFWSSEAPNVAVRPLLTLTIAAGRSAPTLWLLGAADAPTFDGLSRKNE